MTNHEKQNQEAIHDQQLISDKERLGLDSPWIKKLFLPLAASVVASVIVGVITGAISAHVALERLDLRVEALERETVKTEKLLERHEEAIKTDLIRHDMAVQGARDRLDTHEKRITTMEVRLNEMQTLLSEIRGDVKILLRGGQQ